MVMGLEALDYALIIWLNMCSQISLKILDMDALKSIRDNVAREIILEEKDLLSFLQ